MKEKILSLEEKEKMAERMRTSSRYKAVTIEEFDAYSCEEEEMSIATSAGQTRLFIITPSEGVERDSLIINFHGGGFINKRLDRDRLYCFKLASALKCKVLDVDYKLAPEYMYPVAVNECYDVLKWAHENAHALEVDVDDINLIGHSAGGNIAIVITAMALENKLKLVNRLTVEYAPLDLYTDPKDKPRFERDIPADRARVYNSFYCKPEECEFSKVSPILMSLDQLKSFPKTLMILPRQDSLTEENLRFADKLRQASVEVVSEVFEESVHGFTTNRMGAYQEAIEHVTQFMS